jgi:hypothetical protein
VTAIFEKYYRDGPSVRQFRPADRAWISATDPADIDGVVFFYLPPDDSVAGWDVPAERQRLTVWAYESGHSRRPRRSADGGSVARPHRGVRADSRARS